MKRALAARAAVMLVAIGGCSPLGPAGPPVDGPADPEAEMRPDLIVAEPLRIAAGQVLSLSFPAETQRGVHFVLEQEARGTWFHHYDLVSDAPGPGWTRDWSPAGDERFAIPDIGVGGAGPDRVLIPEVAEPGRWRICTGNAGQNICTTIEIVHP